MRRAAATKGEGHLHPVYLRGHDKEPHLGVVDPVQAAQHGEGGQHPPGVAHVRQLLRSSVESAGWELALTQPPAQEVTVHLVQLT